MFDSSNRLDQPVERPFTRRNCWYNCWTNRSDQPVGPTVGSCKRRIIRPGPISAAMRFYFISIIQPQKTWTQSSLKIVTWSTVHLVSSGMSVWQDWHNAQWKISCTDPGGETMRCVNNEKNRRPKKNYLVAPLSLQNFRPSVNGFAKLQYICDFLCSSGRNTIWLDEIRIIKFIF